MNEESTIDYLFDKKLEILNKTIDTVTQNRRNLKNKINPDILSNDLEELIISEFEDNLRVYWESLIEKTNSGQGYSFESHGGKILVFRDIDILLITISSLDNEEYITFKIDFQKSGFENIFKKIIGMKSTPNSSLKMIRNVFCNFDICNYKENDGIKLV